MRILYSISFQIGRIWTKLNFLTHVASKRYFSMMKSWKKMKSEAFKILYVHLKSSMRIYAHILFHLFQFGRIWTKLNFLTHVASKRYFSIMKSWKKWNLRLLKSSMRIYAHISFHLFQFGRIWTKLNFLTHVASKRYFSMMKSWKKIKSETFKILYVHLCA